MADTPRAVAQLLALLADNVTGDISEQDLRDLVVSLIPSLGGMYMEANATATTLAASTWTKIAGTTTAYGDLVDFTMPANNRLTYADTITRHINIVASLAITNGSNNQDGKVALYKNGTIIPGSTMAFKTISAGDPKNLTLIGQVDLAPTDYIEAWIINDTGANDYTVEYLNMSVRGMVHQ